MMRSVGRIAGSKGGREEPQTDGNRDSPFASPRGAGRTAARHALVACRSQGEPRTQSLCPRVFWQGEGEVRVPTVPTRPTGGSVTPLYEREMERVAGKPVGGVERVETPANEYIRLRQESTVPTREVSLTRSIRQFRHVMQQPPAHLLLPPLVLDAHEICHLDPRPTAAILPIFRLCASALFQRPRQRLRSVHFCADLVCPRFV